MHKLQLVSREKKIRIEKDGDYFHKVRREKTTATASIPICNWGLYGSPSDFHTNSYTFFAFGSSSSASSSC